MTWVCMRRNKVTEYLQLLSTGVALFAMMFSGGSIILSIALGRDAGNNVGWALIGFLGATVLIPILGLISVMYYDGNYQRFFKPMGPFLASTIILLCLMLIGPFGVIPRLLVTTHNTLKWYFPQFSLIHFSIVAAAVLFLVALKKNNTVNIIGRF